MLLLLAACATVGTLQSARPIDRHTVQVGAEVAAAAVHASTGDDASTQIQVAIRYGLSDRDELGVRLGTNVPEVQLKHLLADRGPIVSVAPSVGAWSGSSAGVPLTTAVGQVPVLVGLPFGEGSEVVLAPKLLWAVGGGHDLPVWGATFSVGMSAGGSLRLARGIRVVPEVAGAWPFLYAGNELLGSGGAFQLQAGIAALVGGERR